MGHSERHSSIVNKNRLGRAIAYATVFSLCSLLLLPYSEALAQPPSAKAGSGKSQKKGLKIKNQQNNSQETAAERDRRLYRECKGLPNAGACLGYTQR